MPNIIPTWKGNLLIFGILIMIILAYFFWQLKQANRIFFEQMQSYSSMLGGVIELNAESAVLSEKTIKKIMQTFLGNIARFIDYLDYVQPFSADELNSFSKEAGLAGIRIIKADGKYTEGPVGWTGSENMTCRDKSGFIQHLISEHLYFLSQFRENISGCIVVGLTSLDIEKLYEQIGLSYMLKTLPGLAGIKSVKVESGSESDSKKKISETRINLGKDTLIVNINTDYFMARVRIIRNEFFVFSVVIAIIGIFLSWLLYRYQNAYLNQTRIYERKLARQMEDATLGRAAAAITHEIRNPLNAISMGLQRLQIESYELSDESRELVSTLLKAVARTDGIVKNIRRYAMQAAPKKQLVSIETILNHILSLYRPKYEQQRINIKCNIKYNKKIIGDPDMLEEVVENLIKNGIEAQPKGGYIDIRFECKDAEAILSFENTGFELASEQAGQILDPYFTTKTSGTGLGMSITDKIVKAHGGRLYVKSPCPGLIRIDIYLPV